MYRREQAKGDMYMPERWTVDRVLETSGGFRYPCVLMAAAELDVFGALAEGEMSAEALADEIGGDRRATRILADALVAAGLLTKSADGSYANAPGVPNVLTAQGGDSVLAMVRHHANCLRSWSRLAEVVRSGAPAEREPGIRGEEGDLASFIEAMNDVSRREAPGLVAALGPPEFTHLLDVGGGPGTWTIAFLRAAGGSSRATLYDRPPVLPIAREHITRAGLADRVRLVGGSFYEDDALPSGADLAWVSAIVHMNSRRQNRELLAKVHAALADGGRVMIRDVVMGPDRTRPAYGAMFAVNMLANTPGGGTFTFAELAEDLAAVGFADPELVHEHEGMNAVIAARKTPR